MTKKEPVVVTRQTDVREEEVPLTSPTVDFGSVEEEDFSPDNKPQIKVTQPPKGGAPAHLNKVKKEAGRAVAESPVRRREGGDVHAARQHLAFALDACQGSSDAKLKAAAGKIKQAIGWLDDSLRRSG